MIKKTTKKEINWWLQKIGQSNHFSLTEDGYKGQLARAITNTMQSTLNPWGLLGYRAIVVPQHWWFLPINFIYNLLSIVLITLTILAIRRRFRIQSSN